NQVQILRPPFQSFIECPVLWQVPAELPGLSLKWEEFEAVVKSGEGKPARFRGAAAGMDKPRLQPVQLLNKAKEAIAKKEFLTAEELLLEVDSAESALPKQKEDAKSLLRSIQADLERVRAEAARKATIADTLGPEVEPLWLTDLTVTPGKAYRYRLRVLAFNPYVGYATQLENPNDAGRVLVEGAWSEWSDPVEVKPSSYLFFTAARPARIEMHDWTNGQWVIGARSDIKVGDPIAFTESRHDFAYDAAVVAGLNPQINYPERSVSGKDGQISYQERPTASMTLITADGEVEERIASVDLQRRKELRNENRDIDNLCKEFKGLEPVHAPLQERRPPGGPRGRPPAPGLEPGLERGLGQ
ncbi:MAG TPA: hypothetical protein VLM89_01890, partial [Phycisphaerae bacterium]|nr:hypothetical protein [Phycisphaerae bacterium]